VGVGVGEHVCVCFKERDRERVCVFCGLYRSESDESVCTRDRVHAIPLHTF